MDSNYECPKSVANGRQPAPSYSQAIIFAGGQQVVVLVLAALILDSGRTLRLCMVAATGFWVCTLALMLWQRQPSGLAVFVVKWGFWVALVVTAVVRSALGWWPEMRF